MPRSALFLGLCGLCFVRIDCHLGDSARPAAPAHQKPACRPRPPETAVIWAGGPPVRPPLRRGPAAPHEHSWRHEHSRSLDPTQVFRSRIGSLRKALKSRAEFCFVDAPYAVDAGLADDQAVRESGGAGGGRTWWNWQDTEPGMRPSRAARYSGWEASQAAIDEALRQHAPVDGLLGEAPAGC